MLEKFIEYFNFDIESIDISCLFFKIIQVTTNGDNCESIKRYGLLNTQEAIKNDTYISMYLMGKGLKIDFEKENIIFNNKIYHRYDENNSLIERCFTKLFTTSHYPINAFIYSDNPLMYGDEIYKRPEIIGDFANAFTKTIRTDWINNTKCYFVVCKVGIYDLDYSVFGVHLYDFEDQKDIIIKKWLISNSLNIIHDLKIKGEHDDIYAYIKPEIKITPINILECIEVDIK